MLLGNRKNVVAKKSKKGSKDQELIQSSTTPDTGYHMAKRQNTIKHHKREPIGQPFPSK